MPFLAEFIQTRDIPVAEDDFGILVNARKESRLKVDSKLFVERFDWIHFRLVFVFEKVTLY
jgi:hypothetical protein